MQSPEELAREKIDALLQQCGWVLQNRSTINLSASRGVAIREALLKDRDKVDYLLFVDGKAIGMVEAAPGVEKGEPVSVGVIKRTFFALLILLVSLSCAANLPNDLTPCSACALDRLSGLVCCLSLPRLLSMVRA